MDPASLIFLVLVIFATFRRGPMLLYITFIAQSFGSMAAIPIQLTGGVTFTPGWIATALLALQIFVLRRQYRTAVASLRDPRQTGLLLLCSIYGAVSAFLFPRLFAGTVDVIPMRIVLHVAVPLSPVPSNITQAVYFVLTTAIILIVQTIAQDSKGRRQLLTAMMLGGVTAIGTGLLDMAASAAGASAALAPFRNATYSMLVDVELSFARRVVGLMPEASSYAGLCASFLCAIYFLKVGFAAEKNLRWAKTLIPAALFAMVILSTSSSGYVALAMIVAVAMLQSLRELPRVGLRSLTPMLLVYFAVVALLAILALAPSLLDGTMDRLNVVVLQKSKSDSYIERSYWNTQAFETFLGTYGLGAGLGSARASSWPLAVLANLGAPGLLLILGYLSFQIFARPGASGFPPQVVTGAKFALIPLLFMGFLAGTSVNFSFITAVSLGLIGASQASRRSPVPFGGNPRLESHMRAQTHGAA